MKLFTKAALFFISVILLQAALMMFLITNLSKQGYLEDAGKELKQEAAIVAENYNSWKRSLWKNLLQLQAERSTVQRVLRYQDSVTGYLQALLHESGIDAVVIRDAAASTSDIIPISASDDEVLVNVSHQIVPKAHPSLQLRIAEQQLYLIGHVRLQLDIADPSASSHDTDLFLLKRLDRNFCRQLILNRASQVFFFWGNQYLSGTLTQTAFTETFGFINFDALTADIYDIKIDAEGYNIAVQPLETLTVADDARQLALITIVPNTSYIDRLNALERTVMSVALLSAVLTIILSLFLFRNITRPIRKLLAAMRLIRKGNYHVTIDEFQSQHEIEALFQGFNQMARKIRQDKERMEDYIHNITILKDYNEHIIQSIQAGILIINPRLRIEKVNNTFVGYFDLDKTGLIGQSLNALPDDVFDDSIVCHVRAILARQAASYAKVKRSEQKPAVYDIKLYPIEHLDEQGAAAGDTLGCVCVVDDISRKIEFEEKIFQAEKLSSISMLSAGVAHEINNPLGSIMTNVQNLLEEEDDDEKRVPLAWIEKETRRIARIVQKLLDFSSSDLDSSQGSDLNAIIMETLDLIAYSVKTSQDIAMRTDLTENLPPVAMSADECKQVIINLVKNSLQAISGTGQILISTASQQADRMVQLSVDDTGMGINAAHIPRIFDPFYSTKQDDSGTGLGLSVVYGIINKYGGKMSVSSQEGEGTRILIAIPGIEGDRLHA